MTLSSVHVLKTLDLIFQGGKHILDHGFGAM